MVGFAQEDKADAESVKLSDDIIGRSRDATSGVEEENGRRFERRVSDLRLSSKVTENTLFFPKNLVIVSNIFFE